MIHRIGFGWLHSAGTPDKPVRQKGAVVVVPGVNGNVVLDECLPILPIPVVISVPSHRISSRKTYSADELGVGGYMARRVVIYGYLVRTPLIIEQ